MNTTGDPDGIVFVHGGHHDGSCWDLLRPLVDAPSIAVDLPGRGDRVFPGVVITYEMCADAVLADADAAGFERFVLVGHSMGGLTISRIGFVAPERVSRLVYVGALAPPTGTSVNQVFGVDVAPDEPDSYLIPPMDLALARAMFAADMTDEQWAIAGRCIVGESVNLFREPAGEYRHGLPTTFVAMTDDVPVSPAVARTMIEQLGPDVDYRQIDAAHNVMLSRPDALAVILNEFLV